MIRADRCSDRISTTASFLILALGALAAGCSAAPADADRAVERLDENASPQFLEPSEYAAWFALDAKFPFGVVAVHEADRGIQGSRWGRHGGPMVTAGVYGDGQPPSVVRWSFPEVGDAPVRSERGIAIASGLPAEHFYGADGVVDMPFGALSLLSYTGFGDGFPGEALLYGEDLGRVVSRARVNGFYSGIGLEVGGRPRVVYSGLSPLASSATLVQDNGLYAAEVCQGQLAATGCPAPRKLFGWQGQSGPVVADARGNVFVAAALTGAFATDAVFGLTRAEIGAAGAVVPVTLTHVNSGGTSSLAAMAPRDGAEGWLVGRGYDASRPFYATSYDEDAEGLAIGASFLDAAIAPSPAAQAVTVFADDEGDLWLAVVASSGGKYFELKHRP